MYTYITGKTECTMRTIVFANQKGGSSKSTTAVNLAWAFSSLGYRVLTIDLDPQAHLSWAFGITNPNGTVLELLTDEMKLSDVIVDKGVHVI